MIGTTHFFSTYIILFLVFIIELYITYNYINLKFKLNYHIEQITRKTRFFVLQIE